MKPSAAQIAAQLRCPHDEAGSQLGQTMNLRNLTQILSAFAAGGLNPGDRILETGCGNGGLLGHILSLADGLHYTGLEISPLMHQQARAFNEPFIAAGLADYQLYDGGVLPFAAASFHRAVSVNTVYFWDDVPQALAEFCRVLKPAGRLALNFCERDFMAQLPFAAHGFKLYDAADLRALAAPLPLRCLLERRRRDWAVSKSGALVRREFVDLVFERG